MAQPFNPGVRKAWVNKITEASNQGDILRTHFLHAARLTNDLWNVPLPEWQQRVNQVQSIIYLKTQTTEQEFDALLEHAVAQYIGIDVRLTAFDRMNVLRCSGPYDFPLYQKLRAFLHGQLSVQQVLENNPNLQIPAYSDSTVVEHYICPPPATIDTTSPPPATTMIITQPGPGRAPIRRVIHQTCIPGKASMWPILYLMLILGSHYPTMVLSDTIERKNCLYQNYDYNILNPVQVQANRLLDASPFDAAIETYQQLEYTLHKECNMVDNIPATLSEHSNHPAINDIRKALSLCRKINETLPTPTTVTSLNNVEYYMKATARDTLISGWGTINDTLFDLNELTIAPKNITDQFCDHTIGNPKEYPSPVWIWLYIIRHNKLCLVPEQTTKSYPALACDLDQFATRYATLCLKRKQLIEERIAETRLIRDLLNGKAIAMKKPDYQNAGQAQEIPRVQPTRYPPPHVQDPDREVEIMFERPLTPTAPPNLEYDYEDFNIPRRRRRSPRNRSIPRRKRAVRRKRALGLLIAGGIGLGIGIFSNEFYQHYKIAEAHDRLYYIDKEIESLHTVQDIIAKDIFEISKAITVFDYTLRKLDKEVDFLLTDEIIMQSVQSVTTKVTTYSQKLSQILDICASTNDIGSLALDADDLQRIRDEAQTLTNEDIDTTKGTCTLTYTNHGFMVQFNFPILQRERKVQLYQSLCMPTFDDETRYDPDQTQYYFAYSLHSNSYTPLTMLEFTQCLKGICTAAAPTLDESTHLCGATNFFNSTDPCDYNAAEYATPFFHTHNNVTYYKTATKLRVDVHCQNGGPGSEQRLTIDGYGAIKTPDFCYLQIGKKLIFPESFISIRLTNTTTNMSYPNVQHQRHLQQLTMLPSTFTHPAFSTIIKEHATSLVPDMTIILVLVILAVIIYLIYTKIKRQKKWIRRTILDPQQNEEHSYLTVQQQPLYKEVLVQTDDQ